MRIAVNLTCSAPSCAALSQKVCVCVCVSVAHLLPFLVHAQVYYVGRAYLSTLQALGCPFPSWYILCRNAGICHWSFTESLTLLELDHAWCFLASGSVDSQRITGGSLSGWPRPPTRRRHLLSSFTERTNKIRVAPEERARTKWTIDKEQLSEICLCPWWVIIRMSKVKVFSSITQLQWVYVVVTVTSCDLVGMATISIQYSRMYTKGNQRKGQTTSPQCFWEIWTHLEFSRIIELGKFATAACGKGQIP